MKFFVYTFLGSAFLLVGIVAVAFIHQRQTGVTTFDVRDLASTHPRARGEVLLLSRPSRPPSRSRHRSSRSTPGRPMPTRSRRRRVR